MSEQPQHTELHIDENKLIAERKQKLAELQRLQDEALQRGATRRDLLALLTAGGMQVALAAGLAFPAWLAGVQAAPRCEECATIAVPRADEERGMPAVGVGHLTGARVDTDQRRGREDPLRRGRHTADQLAAEAWTADFDALRGSRSLAGAGRRALRDLFGAPSAPRFMLRTH